MKIFYYMKQKYYTALSYTKMQVIEWSLTYKTMFYLNIAHKNMKKS